MDFNVLWYGMTRPSGWSQGGDPSGRGVGVVCDFWRCMMLSVRIDNIGLDLPSHWCCCFGTQCFRVEANSVVCMHVYGDVQALWDTLN